MRALLFIMNLRISKTLITLDANNKKKKTICQVNTSLVKDEMNGSHISLSNCMHTHNFQYNLLYLSIKIYITNQYYHQCQTKVVCQYLVYRMLLYLSCTIYLSLQHFYSANLLLISQLTLTVLICPHQIIVVNLKTLERLIKIKKSTIAQRIISNSS